MRAVCSYKIKNNLQLIKDFFLQDKTPALIEIFEAIASFQ